MARGNVKWFNPSETVNYGFITGYDKKDYFFHMKEVDPGYRPEAGDIVEFKPGTGKKGPQARSVRRASENDDEKADKLIEDLSHMGDDTLVQAIGRNGRFVAFLGRALEALKRFIGVTK